MSPSPRGKHAKLVNILYDQMREVLPAELDAFQVASVGLPNDPDDYAIPDLLVCDESSVIRTTGSPNPAASSSSWRWSPGGASPGTPGDGHVVRRGPTSPRT